MRSQSKGIGSADNARVSTGAAPTFIFFYRHLESRGVCLYPPGWDQFFPSRNGSIWTRPPPLVSASDHPPLPSHPLLLSVQETDSSNFAAKSYALINTRYHRHHQHPVPSAHPDTGGPLALPVASQQVNYVSSTPRPSSTPYSHRLLLMLKIR